MLSKKAGTKRVRGGVCCSHIDEAQYSVGQLRQLLLKLLPAGVQGGTAASCQPYVCLSCLRTADKGSQEAGNDCDHLVSLDTHRLELHCSRCQDYVYLECFDEALLIACQQWMQRNGHSVHCSIPSNDPGPALLSKRQKLGAAPSPEPGCKPNSNSSSQTAADTAGATAAGAAGADQQAASLLAAAAAGSWEDCVASDGLPLGLRGLNNLGNTCFMNSVLQVMMHAPLLRSFYLGEGHDPGSCRLTARDKPCLSCQMDTVFGEVYSGNRQPFSPADFLYQWWRFADSLAGYQQQDAHEFYLSLLEGLSGSVIFLGPPAAAAGTTAGTAAGTSRGSPAPHQQAAGTHQQQPQQQPQQQLTGVHGSCSHQGQAAAAAAAGGGYLNVLGGSLPGLGAAAAAGGLPGVQTRQHLPMVPAALRQHHFDAAAMQPTQQQQQRPHVELPGSNGVNGWPLDPTSQDQQQQQQQSGPGGDLSGYETPISSGATPEPEGDMEAASRPPESGPGAVLVDLVFSGLLRSDVRCCACGHTSTAHDPFRDISLDLHVPRPPRLPPLEAHHRPPAAPPAAAGAATAVQAGRGGQQAEAGGPQHGSAAGAAAGAGEEASPAVAAAAKRLGISAPLATAGLEAADLMGLREATPPLVVGMTPSPTPPPSDLLMEYWDNNTDTERDTAAGGGRGLLGRDAGAASQATSMSLPLSAVTGAEEGDGEGEGGLSTGLSRGEGEEEGEEDEVRQQGEGSQGPAGAAADGAGSGKGQGGRAGGDAVSGATQAGSLSPELLSEGGEQSERSEKSPGASEVGGPVASQSSQQVGGGGRAGGHREATPELDTPAVAAGDGRGAGGPSAAAATGGLVEGPARQWPVDLRESTPQSTATQPSQQQQEQAGTVQQQQQQQQQQEQAGTVSQQQQQQQSAQQPSVAGPASLQQAAEGAVAMDADADAAGAAGVGSSLVCGVGGGLSQFVKAPMTALKQTAIKLLPTWGAPAGEQQPQGQQQHYAQQFDTPEQQAQQSQGEQQQQQQPDQPFQQPQPEQQQQPDQAFQEQQQQQLGTFPCGYPDMSGLAEAGSYDLAGMQEYAAAYADQMQPYDQQAYEAYMQGWGMAPYGDAAYDPAAYSGDWMQQAQMYNSGGYGDAAAAAAVPAGPGGSGGGSKGSKSSAAAAVKLKTRCGSCKYCLNRHLKKGCEANKRLREEAKAAAKAQGRSPSDDRAAAQRSMAQHAVAGAAAAAAADPAAAAALPVGGPLFSEPAAGQSAAVAAGGDATQPMHPLGGMDTLGATAGAGWAHPGGSAPMYQQFNPVDYYTQQQMQQQQQLAPGAGSYKQQAPAGTTPKPSKAAAAAAKMGERLVAAAFEAGLLKKRDDKGRFYRKEHLAVWARLLYERGQLCCPGVPPVTAEAAAAAAAAQDAATAAGTGDWPLPPWLQPQEAPAAAQPAAATARTGGAAAARSGAAAAGGHVRPASAPPAVKASGQGSKAAVVKKGSSASGAAVGKKAQPALLRMNDLTLAGCLRRYVRPERLGAAAHWRCSACGSSTAALKQLSFRRLPLVLCFHVKRFEHGGAAQRPRKLDVPLSFPLHGLDMAPFTTSHMLRGVARAPHCRPAPAANGSTAPPAPAAAGGEGGPGAEEGPSFAESCLYELFGVVSHMGDMSSGHYVSYIKCDGSWYLINDPWVVAVSEADVAQVQAYMLFYAQEQLFGTGSTGELAEQQREQRADAAAAVVAAAAAATAKAGAGVKCKEGVVKCEAGGGQAEGDKAVATAGAGAAQGSTAGPGGAAVKQEPGQ